jgi:hypothetical protein
LPPSTPKPCATTWRARAAAPDAKVWAIVKANAYGHGIERVFDALRSADGFALLDLAEAQRLRALDWRGPILLLEGCSSARPGAVLAPGPVARHPLRRADRHAGRAQDAGAAPRVPQDELGHEPPGFRPERFPPPGRA